MPDSPCSYKVVKERCQICDKFSQRTLDAPLLKSFKSQAERNIDAAKLFEIIVEVCSSKA